MAAEESKASGGGEYAISLESVRAAAARIRDHVHRTPAMTCETLDRMAHASLLFKCECFQKTGSFKARGATNAILALSDDAAAKGVCTHSSGNHGQGVAFAAAARGIPATVVMPDVAPAPKVAAVKGYGAEVIMVPTSERDARCQQVIKESGMTKVHPSNDPDVMAGQGTLALELLEQARATFGITDADKRPLDAVIVPVGGGGLISGVATAIKALHPDIDVYGAEPKACDDAARSKACGAIQGNDAPFVTVADGLKTTLGSNTWPVVRDKVDIIITVSEEDIIAGMRLVWERMKVLIEPSAGTGVAVALSSDFQAQRAAKGYARVAIVLCGGNTDLDKLPFRAVGGK